MTQQHLNFFYDVEGCYKCGRTINHDPRESKLDSPVWWKCQVCERLICRGCTLLKPNNHPDINPFGLLEYYDETYCSDECRIIEETEKILHNDYTMSSWDDYRETCTHGIREGLDDHSCGECQEIAKLLDFDMSNGKTYIFTATSYKKYKKKIDEAKALAG